MQNPDIFDEIISYLQNCSKTGSSRTAIAPELCKQFFTDTPQLRPSPAIDLKTAGVKSVNSSASQAPPAKLTDLSAYDLLGLHKLTAECTRCPLCEHRINIVFGDGNPNADLMFIGEAPGYHEDMQGIPFVGDAGNLLTKMITAMRYSRPEVYIGNIVKCRPPNNRNPNDDEAACCLPYLNRQIELIKPRVIVLLGAIPLKYLLHRSGINRHHGQWFEYQGIPVIATFHPAYLLRYQAAKRDAWHDLQMVMKKLAT